MVLLITCRCIELCIFLCNELLLHLVITLFVQLIEVITRRAIIINIQNMEYNQHRLAPPEMERWVPRTFCSFIVMQFGQDARSGDRHFLEFWTIFKFGRRCAKQIRIFSILARIFQMKLLFCCHCCLQRGWEIVFWAPQRDNLSSPEWISYQTKCGRHCDEVRLGLATKWSILFS